MTILDSRLEAVKNITDFGRNKDKTMVLNNIEKKLFEHKKTAKPKWTMSVSSCLTLNHTENIWREHVFELLKHTRA